MTVLADFILQLVAAAIDIELTSQEEAGDCRLNYQCAYENVLYAIGIISTKWYIADDWMINWQPASPFQINAIGGVC